MYWMRYESMKETRRRADSNEKIKGENETKIDISVGRTRRNIVNRRKYDYTNTKSNVI